MRSQSVGAGLRHPELVGSTLTFRGQGLAQALESLAEAGFRGVEVCAVPGFCPHLDFSRDPRLEAQSVLPVLDRLSLEVVSVNAAPGNLVGPDADAATQTALACFDLAAGLGAEVVVLPAGQSVDEDDWEQAARQYVGRLVYLADEACARGLDLCVEAPHWKTLAPTLEWAERLFELAAHPGVGCAFDTSHVARGERIALCEGFRRVGADRVRHIHLRDVIGEDTAITPGRGNADFAGLFRELRTVGYAGYLVLESELDGGSRRKQSEIRFASACLVPLIRGLAVPLGIRVRTTSIVKVAERLVLEPKQELRRHGWLAQLMRSVRPSILRLLPIKTYDGQWRNRWVLGNRDKIVRLRSHSAALARNPSQPVRVGIVGCGYAGTMHAYGYDRLAGVQVVGVCDANPERASRLAAELRCPSYSHLDALLKTAKPDLVSICTREWMHRDHALEALEAGADVFCEKIMATRASHAREMVDRARELGRVLGVNYNYRFIPGIAKLKEIIESGVMGRLLSLTIKVHAFSYHHALDLVQFLGGPIQGVAAKYELVDSERKFGGTNWDVYDPDIIYIPGASLVVAFSLNGGATACITTSSRYNAWGFVLAIDAVLDGGAVALSGINYFDVVGSMSWTAGRERGGIKLDQGHGVLARGYETCFYRSVESFVNAYVTNRRPETPGEAGLFNVELERAVYRSGARGRCEPVLDQR